MIKTVIIFQQAIHYALSHVHGIVLREGYDTGPLSFISLYVEGRAFVEGMSVLPASLLRRWCGSGEWIKINPFFKSLLSNLLTV